MANFRLGVTAKKFLSQTVLNKLGLAAIRIIRKRTREGRDWKGNPFQKYSAGWLNKRRGKGILNADTVNLEYSRRGMMSKIDHMISRDLTSVQIYFTDAQKEQLARYHNIMGAGKSKVIRKFFWIESQDEINNLQQIAYTEVDKLFRRL